MKAVRIPYEIFETSLTVSLMLNPRVLFHSLTTFIARKIFDEESERKSQNLLPLSGRNSESHTISWFFYSQSEDSQLCYT